MVLLSAKSLNFSQTFTQRLFCLPGELQWACEEVHAREGNRKTQYQQGAQQ